MGVDPITMGMVGSAALSAYGQYKSGNEAKDRFNAMQSQGQSMMKTGNDPYQQALMKMLSGHQGPMALDPNSGAIDPQSIMQNFNPGQDALSQFLRSDPSRQTGFDTSKSFDALQAMDSRNQGSAIAALNSNFGGLGQRFGGAAMRQTSDLLANMNAQTGARNAGIFQQSFENQQNRSLQGSGLMLQGAQALSGQGNAMAQLAAQLASQNQGNQQWNQQFNQNNRNTAFNQQLQGIQAGFGMQNANDQYNAGLFGVMNGQQAPTGNGYSAVGGAGMDISQLMMFMNQMNKPPAGGTPNRAAMPNVNPLQTGGAGYWGY